MYHKLACALLLMGTAVAAPADTLEQPLLVSERIVANCSLSKVQDLSFGSYLQAEMPAQPAAGDELAKGVFDVECGRDVAYRIRFGGGANAQGGVRRMRLSSASDCSNPADCIFYRLYRNTGRTQIINIGAQFNFAPITAADHIRTLNVYGQFDNSLDYRPGDYSDTIAITLSY
jgi:spore coat protein U-like protein